MTLRERIENNLTVWLLSTLLAGFLAGIVTYQSILEIAQLEVISKSKLEQLEQAGIAREAPIRDAPVAGSPIASDLDPATSSPTPQESLRFSSRVPPFPEDFDLVRPGMKFSEARLAFPDGELGESWYSVDIESGPFSHVGFHSFSKGGEDPVIEAVIFYFRDRDSRASTFTAVLREYGEVAHESETLGAKLIWPNLHGFQLAIDNDSYNIALAASS